MFLYNSVLFTVSRGHKQPGRSWINQSLFYGVALMLKKHFASAEQWARLFILSIRCFLENCLELIIIFKFVNCNSISQVCFVYLRFDEQHLQIQIFALLILNMRIKYTVTMSFARRRNVRRRIFPVYALLLYFS